MSGDARCAKCDSRKVLPFVDIVTKMYGADDLSVEVHEDPHALVFKGRVRSPLVARVCCECGYVELYVRNPAELWKASLRNPVP